MRFPSRYAARVAIESLLTEELRSFIGRSGPEVTVYVSAGAVERAADVFRGTREGLALAPGAPVPGFVLAALESDVPRVAPPEPLPKSLLVSNEWHFERPLRLGEALTAQAKVADITERLGGRFGQALYVRTEVEFRDDAGALVARSSMTLMHYDPSGASPAGEEES
ncbi:hypothetical protein HRbin29_00476 [bacterium HR29]|jgi:hypothetical protein|nr:hypothetical protein HRbin29_00476 [bacterium HR29]